MTSYRGLDPKFNMSNEIRKVEKIEKKLQKQLHQLREDFEDGFDTVKDSLPEKHHHGRHIPKSQMVIFGFVINKSTFYMVIAYILIFVAFALYIILTRGNDGNDEKLEGDHPNAPPVQPGNKLTKGGWNDTPTIGMTGEYDKQINPVTNEINNEAIDPTFASTPVPDGMPPISPKYCTTPTGFLMRIVQAYNKGLRNGIVTISGVSIDMGSEGAFYDRWGDGCCDSYCRIVTNGKYWSCVDPSSRTSQYIQSYPRGRKCEKYGNERNKLPDNVK